MSFDKLDKNDLKKHGLKITVPRLKILTLLEQSATHHMSAEDIYKALLASGEDVGLLPSIAYCSNLKPPDWW